MINLFGRKQIHKRKESPESRRFQRLQTSTVRHGTISEEGMRKGDWRWDERRLEQIGVPAMAP